MKARSLDQIYCHKIREFSSLHSKDRIPGHVLFTFILNYNCASSFVMNCAMVNKSPLE